ncbi:hypothetical protein ATK86_5535 [Nocardia fluminea]|uniref:Uncharacterized protein n=2 Tax=Nocardia fluminea TaxID=134984 RepID=A0A2N3VHM1_9NOCA|nr:hypothetical protein ATK86_5535 [Nocardia fluminea]
MTHALNRFEPSLREIAGPVFTEIVTTTLTQQDWAEDEISRAQQRHPDVAGVLHHSFSLLTATHERMSTEFIYRAHARELIERVATGVSTKPGTSVEVVLLLMRASLVTPLNTTAFGLYLRMWRQAGLPDLGGPIAGLDGHYEAIDASGIDDFEAIARRKLAMPSRVLTLVACEGRHLGEPADCRFASARAA